MAGDPKATVHLTFTGSFSDVGLMANAAKAYVAGGADVLTGSAQAVVGAIGVAKSQNVLWFGNDADQSSLAPQQVVSSNVYDWTGILTQMLTAIDNGTLGGASYTATLGNGGMKVVFNSAYALPANVQAQAQKLIDQEVRRLVDSAHDEVVALLQHNRERLDALAQALLEHETLDQADAYAAAGIDPPPDQATAARPLIAAARSNP